MWDKIPEQPSGYWFSLAAEEEHRNGDTALSRTYFKFACRAERMERGEKVLGINAIRTNKIVPALEDL